MIFGAGNQYGPQFYNLARMSLFTAGLPQSLGATTLDRKCASGLTAVALAARSIMADDADMILAGGVESVSMTRLPGLPDESWRSQSVIAAEPDAYMAMIETAEVVAERYGVSREAQDRYAVESQHRAAAAIEAGRQAAEIAPLPTEKIVRAKDGSETGREEVNLTADEACARTRAMRRSAVSSRSGAGARLLRKAVLSRRQCQPAVGWGAAHTTSEHVEYTRL